MKKKETEKLNSLYTKWGKEINRECPLADYPRPQLKRDNWVCLNGKWEYAIRDGREKSEPKSFDGDILVPFSPESLLSGVGRQLKPGQMLWYRRKIDFDEVKREKKVLLNFGAVDQHCTVYLNGREIGKHSGGYWPFSFDITEFLVLGDNELVVYVTDGSDTGDEAYGKQKLKRGEMWYTAQSGIWQTVWYEIVPENYIKNIRITPLYKESAVEIEIESEIKGGEAIVFDGGKAVARCRIENGYSRIDLPDFKKWSPDSPFLYDLEVVLGDDVVKSYFGMREFSVGKNACGQPCLLLNGEPIFHNGLLDQGYWSDGIYTPPSDEAMVWEISQIKKMGFNMLRKHIKIEPLRWYYHCDRLGILVWQDFVNGGGPYMKLFIKYAPWFGIKFGDNAKRYFLHGRKSKTGRNIFLRDAERTMKLLHNVVSLSVWVPFNEGWGQFKAKKVCEMVKAADSTRQVDHASGYHDQGAGDFHSYHIYYKRFCPKRDRHNRVLALTEFGGFSLPKEGHMAAELPFGYKIFDTQDELDDALEDLYQKDVFSYIPKGLCAVVYTQVSDIEDEINGLFTYDRAHVKVDDVRLADMNNKLYEAFSANK